MVDDSDRIRERMELLSAASFEGLFFHVDGVILDVNQRLAEMLGYAPHELLGAETLRRCVAPEDVPTVLKTIASGYEGEYAITVIRKDGSRFRAELQAKQGKLGDRPIRVAAVRDVTERERTQALLRESEARLRELAQATFDIIVFSVDGVIVEVGGEIKKVLGYDRERMVGRKVLDFVAESATPAIKQVLEEQRVGGYETLVVSDGGETIPMEVVALHTTLHGQPVRMSALRDLRGARLIESERRKLEQAFERSQRLDGLGVLAGGIAHDFNNLLTAVLGRAELLGKRTHDPNERELIRGIIDAGQRAASLTAQMLAYAGRAELGPRKPVDLEALVREACAALDSSLTENARITMSIAPESYVCGSSTTLTQVIVSLLTNALEALDGRDGEVRLTTRRLQEPEPRFKHALGAKVGPGPLILLEVSDTGAGMSTTTLGRIFEPFFTTKSRGQGLGLAMCVGIISSHEGAILAESMEGKGSTFSVLLPAHDGAIDAKKSSAKPTSIRSALVVDDEPLVRAHLKDALTAHGYTVIEAVNGHSALEAIAKQEPSIVLLDMTMPDLCGAEVLRYIRANGSRVPVVLSSGYSDAAKALEPSSFQGFLVKPYTMAELLGTLERALAKTTA